MTKARSLLLLIYVSFILPFVSSCDCGSATGLDCYRDNDCPDCQTCHMGKCRQSEEICDDGLDNDCDGYTDEDCEDLCEGVVCLSPPPRECLDDTTLKFYNLPGYCVDGECRYSSTEYTCERGCEGNHCVENICIGLHCGDNNPCTDDGCDPSSGCTYVPNADSCEDGDMCTYGDVCIDGVCHPGETRNCDDGIDCTDDSCEPSSGCVYSPDDSKCDNGNPCTDDVCSTTSGCVYTNNSDPCDDEDPCTMDDFCGNGTCQGVPLDNDGDGFSPFYCWGEDCDDEDFNTNPDAEEICNGKDNNCDGLIDIVGRNYCDYDAICQEGALVSCLNDLGTMDTNYVVTENMVWCANNSPVIHNGVTVLSDAVLTVGPCIDIRAKEGVSISVRGKLDVRGRELYPAVFTSYLNSPNRSSWAGIELYAHSDATAFIDWAVVEHARKGFDVDLCGSQCSSLIKNSIFQHNESAFTGYNGHPESLVLIVHSCGVFDNTYGVDSLAARMEFHNSTFSGNEYALYMTNAIDLYDCSVTNNVVGLSGGRGIASGCFIADNTEAGVEGVLSGVRMGFELTGNTIINNRIGIIAIDDNWVIPPVQLNTICDNTEFDIKVAVQVDMDATNNWWCTTDPDVISSRIYDVYDDSNLGRVIFEPFLEEEP